MPHEVVPGETGWIDCLTDRRHTFEVKLPRLCLTFVTADGELPGGRVTLRAAGHDEARSFAAAAPGRLPGTLELGFRGADAAAIDYGAALAPDGGAPYPLVHRARLEPRLVRPSSGPPTLSTLAPLALRWRGEAHGDRAPVRRRHVLLELTGPDGAAGWHPFVTDDRGLVRVAPAGTDRPGPPAWVDVARPPRLRVAVGRRPFEGASPAPDAVQEVQLERSEPRLLATLVPDPRLSIPVTLSPAGGQDQAAASRAWLRDHAFDVAIDGAPVDHGVCIDGRGRLEVAFRCEVGPHQVVVAGHAKGATDARRDRVVFFARKVVVRRAP